MRNVHSKSPEGDKLRFKPVSRIKEVNFASLILIAHILFTVLGLDSQVC